MTNQVLCAGSIALDTTTTPFIKVKDVLGGAGTFSAFAASFFGPVALVSIVGSDFPKSHWKAFEGRGINLEGIQVVEGGKTFSYESEFSFDMHHRTTIRTDLNVLAGFDPKVPANARASSYVYLATMPPELQSKVLGQLNGTKLSFLDTIEFFIENNLDVLKDVVGKVDGFVINDGEARKITGENSLLKAGKKITEMGPSIVVIKKGEHGSLLFFQGAVYPFPAFPLEEIVDPTGAGDCFAGAMIGYLAKMGATKDAVNSALLRKAVAYGTVLGSFTVEGFSVDSLRNLTSSDIEGRLSQYKALLEHF